MDYSLLIGLHFRDDYSDDEKKSPPCDLRSGMNFIYLALWFCLMLYDEFD